MDVADCAASNSRRARPLQSARAGRRRSTISDSVGSRTGPQHLSACFSADAWSSPMRWRSDGHGGEGSRYSSCTRRSRRTQSRLHPTSHGRACSLDLVGRPERARPPGRCWRCRDADEVSCDDLRLCALCGTRPTEASAGSLMAPSSFGMASSCSWRRPRTRACGSATCPATARASLSITPRCWRRSTPGVHACDAALRRGEEPDRDESKERLQRLPVDGAGTRFAASRCAQQCHFRKEAHDDTGALPDLHR